jgi:7-cyano-7-deazaguanine synthase
LILPLTSYLSTSHFLLFKMSDIHLDLTRIKNRDAVVACVSGGLDSCVMLARLSEVFQHVYPIFVRNGHHWEDAEIAALQRFITAISRASIAPLLEIRIPLRQLLDEHWGERGYRPRFNDGYAANFIPGRNIMILGSVITAAYVRNAHNIALGLLKGNPYPDAQLEFFQAFELMVARGMSFDTRVITPMLHLEKEQVIQLGADLPLELSLSCANPQDGRHCGAQCNKCAERQKGFALAGLPDQTDYAELPPSIDWHNHQWID